MKVSDIKVNLEELKKEKQKNFKERLWFIRYWTNYIKTHSDEDWSAQQKTLIDSQINNARSFVKAKTKTSQTTGNP